jgi:hypothetical protein
MHAMQQTQSYRWIELVPIRKRGQCYALEELQRINSLGEHARECRECTYHIKTDAMQQNGRNALE